MENGIDNINFEAIDFNNIITQFHFIRPWWLLAFFALFLVLFLIKKIRYYQSPWQHFLPSHLASTLLENSQTNNKQIKSSQTSHWLKPFIIGSCTILALAGPAWQKLPQPVYQLDRGAVIIMDMSYSMFATDVKPNRLTRARYKAIDLLTFINEGDIGLIAYAGDAFIISPLTQDDNNIALLLPSLSPDIMPVAGANALAALTLADSTLKNAGHISGDIYWFTDDLDNDEVSDVFDWASTNNHTVNILGIGTSEGSPITLSNGKLLKDNRGSIVVPKLPENRLAAFARASRGVYRTMTNDNSDIEALTAHLSVDYNDALDSSADKADKENQEEQAMLGDQYQEQGPWLLIIILPLLLSYFRRGSSILTIGWLMPLALAVSLTTISPTSYAAQDAKNEQQTSGASQFWQDLWQTPDQQGQQHYQQEDYQQAAKQFKDSQWQGSAHYKAGEYEKALESFQQTDTAQSLYNQGNALAQLQKVEEAIDAYKQALEKDPDLTDAKENLETLEKLKEQQQQNQESEDSSDGEQQESDQNQEGQQNEGDQNDSGEQSQDQSQQDPQGEQDQSQQGDSQEESNGDDKTDQQQNEAGSDQEKSEEELKEQAAQQAKEGEEDKDSEEKSAAQQAIDSKAKETSQKHQQLLNKVTDDPYLLLRNKMSLEYKKRQHDGSQQGVTKQW